MRVVVVALAMLLAAVAGGGTATAATAPVAAPPPAAVPPNGLDLALALTFRPRLFFDGGERWRPTDVDRFLAEPGHRACPPKASGAPCVPFTSVDQLTSGVAYLDLRGTSGSDATAPDLATCLRSKPNLRDCDQDGRSVIYARVTRELTHTAIDYWWFLRYNALNPDNHEGDWEGVTVVVDPAGTQVLETHLAAHKGVWRYPDGIARVVGGHLLVNVARNSHAAYPRACGNRLLPCWQTGSGSRHSTLPEGRFDGADRWIGNSAAGCRRLCVRLLPLAADGAPASWNAWRGRWGRPVRLLGRFFQPPLTPAFQGRYLHPFAADATLRRGFS